MGYLTILAMKTVIYFLILTLFNLESFGNPKHYLIETIGNESLGNHKHIKVDDNGEDYTHGKRMTAYLKLFNSLSPENKIKVENRIKRDFDNDIEKVKRAAKSGELERYLKNIEDYDLDLHIEQDPHPGGHNRKAYKTHARTFQNINNII